METSTFFLRAALPVVAAFSFASSSTAHGQDDMRTGNQPAISDPYDHTAYVEVGVFHRADASSLGLDDTKTTFLPMRFGVSALAMRHLQVTANFALAGMLLDTPLDDRQRTFQPGNLSLGGYYAFGNAEHAFGESEWSLGAGGQLVAPTAQNADDAQRFALAGGAAVHGLENVWSFQNETFSIVPGAYGRWAYGPLFANFNLDMGFGIATGGGDRAHHLQVRGEVGWRVETDLRLGVGYTEIVAFGDAAPSDRAQGALRVFFRADLKILTFGTELVMNIDDPLGFAFDDGIWGVVTRLGLSL